MTTLKFTEEQLRIIKETDPSRYRKIMYTRKYYQENRTELRTYAKAEYKANPEYYRQRSADRRRIRKEQANANSERA